MAISFLIIENTCAITIPTGFVLKKIGVPIGNAGLKEILNDPEKLVKLPPPGKLFVLTSIVAPVVEELKYRALPSAALNFAMRNQPNYTTTSSALPAALATSAWFGHVHNKGAEKLSLPLAQFTGGMLYW